MKSREFHKTINELLVANLCPDDEVFVGTDGGQLVIMTSDSDISGIEEELCFRRVTLQELDDVLLETNFEDTFENRFSHMACDHDAGKAQFRGDVDSPANEVAHGDEGVHECFHRTNAGFILFCKIPL